MEEIERQRNRDRDTRRRTDLDREKERGQHRQTHVGLLIETRPQICTRMFSTQLSIVDCAKSAGRVKTGEQTSATSDDVTAS